MHIETERSLQATVAEHADRYVTESEDLLADFEGLDLIEVLKATGRFLGLAAGEAAANRAMFALLQAAPVFHDPHDPDQPWDVQLENVGVFDSLKWPAGYPFFELNAYAYGGFYARGVSRLKGIDLPLSVAELYAYLARQPSTEQIRNEAQREAALERLIEQCAGFLSAIPANWKLDLRHLRRTLSAAQARRALDRGQTLHPDGLAHLGRLNPRTLRNMMSAGQFSPVDGRITPEEALTWLAKRKDFRLSIWREQDEMRAAHNESEPSYDEVLFVPVARDRSWFRPELAREGEFAIGDPQEQVTGFRAALERLQRMPIPKWWRPNKKGNWGIVAGEHWERRAAAELTASEAPE